VSKWSDARVRKTTEPVPSRLLESEVSTIKVLIITSRVTMTSKAWPHKLSLKASVTRSIAALKTARSLAGNASLTTRSTVLKAASTPSTSKAVSHLTAVGRILPTTLVELILVPPGSLLPLNPLPSEAKLLQVAIPLAKLTVVDRLPR